ncbi:hypothetical protein [Actinophytocola xinjiangensis]|uniref:hypothetical protein n=1 Tax=Actinophytocola xinjiangensis TaxID=485602 RepID=UPI0013900F06|nr:hypothetical protein [Actinophytocola xinjiangensis]
MRRYEFEAVRCVVCEGYLRREGMALTDTPIYDQIRQELEAGGARAERPTARRSRAADEPSQTVSVWSLVNQHRTGKSH